MRRLVDRQGTQEALQDLAIRTRELNAGTDAVDRLRDAWDAAVWHARHVAGVEVTAIAAEADVSRDTVYAGLTRAERARTLQRADVLNHEAS